MKTNNVEKLKKRALELSETKKELKEQKKISSDDLSIVNKLLNLPLNDASAIMDIASLSKTADTEQILINKNLDKNQDGIDETSNETDDFIKGLRDNIRRLNQMEKTSDLVNTGQQIEKTQTRIDELEEVKKILGVDSQSKPYGTELPAGNSELTESLNNDNVIVNRIFNQSNTPRSLSVTQQKWEQGDTILSERFGSPFETARTLKLNSNQGYAVKGFRGTCGLVSCENVLKMAGVTITEKEIIEYASTHRKSKIGGSLCTVGKSPDLNGGTTCYGLQKILEHFGLPSNIQKATVENIANAVIEGRGVMVTVNSAQLWNNKSRRNCGHVVTVTSVQRRKYDGEIDGFYICDSGVGGKDSAAYYTAEEIRKAIKRKKINVTSNIIR